MGKRPRMGMRLLNDDMMPNPLLGLPRNMQCPCGSGKKFKHCCLALTRKFIRKDALAEHKLVMAEALAGAKAW
jgi:hypothetical protein